jgi:micrococcal nuclease
MNIGTFLRGALALAALAGCARGMVAADDCRVERVADGDTFYCRDGRKIRLIGIDTPELAQGGDGRLALEALRRLLPQGRAVRLELDVAPRDRFGRTLAHVWAGGRLVNEAMVRGGWAVLYTVPPNVRYVRRLETAQQAARAARAGLWQHGGFDCPPADFRRGRCRRRPRQVRARRTRRRSVTLSRVRRPTSAPPASTTGMAGSPLERSRSSA